MTTKPSPVLASEEVVERSVEWLLRRATGPGTTVVGISGAQGSGKTTLTERMARRLRQRETSAVTLSLDDFYLPRAERQRLASQRHPLFETRGVPKTHDVPLLRDTLLALRSGQGVIVPVFDKSRDDRVAIESWRQIPALHNRYVLLEGWCLGVPPQSDEELDKPLNDLEANEDADGSWRRAVNDALRGEYHALFEDLDLLLVLLAPNFDVVLDWRAEQEAELKRRAPGPVTMSRRQLERFVQHFERLTRHALRVLPARADAVLRLDAKRRVLDFAKG